MRDSTRLIYLRRLPAPERAQARAVTDPRKRGRTSLSLSLFPAWRSPRSTPMLMRWSTCPIRGSFELFLSASSCLRSHSVSLLHLFLHLRFPPLPLPPLPASSTPLFLHRPEFVSWDHLRIRNKAFPWRNGDQSLFHHPKYNAVKDGYEDQMGGDEEEEEEEEEDDE